jgi:hypothetical protein
MAMKTFLIILCLMVGVGPAQATTQTPFNQDKPEGIYAVEDKVEESHSLRWQTTFTPEGEGCSAVATDQMESLAYNHHWYHESEAKDGGGKEIWRTEYSESPPPSGSSSTCTKTKSWPVVGPGVMTYSGDCSSPPSAVDPPPITMGHWDVDLRETERREYGFLSGGCGVVRAEGEGQWQHTVSADTKLKLHTGGKGVAGRKNLWVVTGDATERLPVLSKWPFPSEPWLSWPGGTSRPSAPTRVTMGELGTLGSDGRRYVALPDGVTKDATPTVVGVKNYNFTAGATKHKLWIRANGVILNFDELLAKPIFCVGQKVTFTSDWDQAPPGLTGGSGWDWVASAKCVNTNWYRQRYVPSPDGNGEWVAYGSPLYANMPDLWRVAQPHAWWISGGDKNAKLDETLTFANGQKVALAAKGNFTIHRPTFKNYTDVNPDFPNSGRSFLWNGDVLSYGDSDSGEHGLYWQVEVDSDFNGDLGILQLVNAHYTQNHGWCPACRDTLDTHGEFWLDGSGENYEQKEYAIQYPLTHKIYMTDHPAEELWPASPINVRIWGQFKDYLRFRPSGTDSIFVTLGKNDWYMEGKATVTDGITINNTPAPSGLVESDEFPVWTQIQFE